MIYYSHEKLLAFLFKGRTNLPDIQPRLKYTSYPLVNIDHNDRDITIMSSKESPSSTPPTTHAEHMDQDPHYRATSVAGLPPLQEHGVGIDHKIPQDDVVTANPDLLWSRIRHYMREPFAEFFGKQW